MENVHCRVSVPSKFDLEIGHKNFMKLEKHIIFIIYIL